MSTIAQQRLICRELILLDEKRRYDADENITYIFFIRFFSFSKKREL